MIWGVPIAYIVALILLVLFLLFYRRVSYAIAFKKIAALKGYGKDAHAFSMVFLHGMVGMFYVYSLPDMVAREQTHDIVKQLKEK